MSFGHRAAIHIFSLLLLVQVFGTGSTRAAEWTKTDIAIVQSSRIKPYIDAVSGFRQAASNIYTFKGTRRVLTTRITELVLTDFESQREVRRILATMSPRLILAVGTSALLTVREIENIPVIYIMVPYPGAINGKRKNITGIRMNIRPETQLSALLRETDDFKRIGLIYDPDQSSDFVKKIINHAGRYKKVEIITRKTRKTAEVPQLIDSLAGRIDLFWMIPDKTVVTPATLEYLLLFSLQNRVPIVTFSDKYLRLGATFSLSFDVSSIGAQAADMAQKVFNGTPVSEIEVAHAEKVKFSVNAEVAESLGLKTDQPEASGGNDL